MRVSRRWVTVAGAAALLSGCGGGMPSSGGGAAGPGGLPPDLRPVPNAGWNAWVAAFRDRAQVRGIAPATLSSAFRDAGYLPGVVERDRNQTEVERTLEDYLAIVANETKVQQGRAALRQRGALLSQIEGRYGVPANVVAAIWGMESNYGTRRGDIPVISATSTLAYDGRRGDFFEKQLMAALRILQRGDVPASRLTGSWAGAMGHTQFIPTTFEAYAVDFGGDGRRDIWSDDPTDGLASAAAYLSKSGWRTGQPWGLEVSVPAGVSGGRRSVGEWRALGVTRAGGGAVPDHGSAALLRPMGSAGPAFLAFRNFNVILRYNNAEKYGIGVGHLSDRLAGGGPIRADFGPDRYGMTIEDRKALQRGLNAAGFDAGTPDGVLGKKTEAAIRAYQQRVGLPVTGTPTRELLSRLG